MAKIEFAKRDPLTEALGERLRRLWDAYTGFDAATHDDILAEDYRAVHPDGTVHLGKPTTEDIAAAPIEDYGLSELQAWPIAESCYLLRNLSGAPEAVIDNVTAGIFQIPLQLSRECPAVRNILRKYRDRKIGLADACLIQLAEEFGTGEILTLDQGFAIYRWGRNKAFRLLPERG